jgi:hypothetical protein
MSRAYIVRGLVLVAVLAWSSWPSRSILATAGGPGPAATSSSSCPVSHPNGGHPPGQLPDRWYHGTGGLWTILWPRSTATVPPQNVQRNGRLYVKVPWYREPGSQGTLRIHGHRLDNPAPALRADVPTGYGNLGFQASAILFPTVGCWQVTGRAGRGSLTMVMRVLKVPR